MLGDFQTMFHKFNYKFTNKKHPTRGIMGAILGAISLTSIMLALYFTVLNKGQALHQYGTVAILTTIFSFVGLGLGIAGVMEKDVYHVFPILGIILNVLSIGVIGIILLSGVNCI